MLIKSRILIYKYYVDLNTKKKDEDLFEQYTAVSPASHVQRDLGLVRYRNWAIIFLFIMQRGVSSRHQSTLWPLNL